MEVISLIDICSDKQTLLLEFVCISDLKLNLLMSFLAFLSEEKKTSQNQFQEL